MWLLDANMEVKLRVVLSGFGIRSETAAHRGWRTLRNGNLVEAAVGAGFECVLTHDSLFGESAAKALKEFSGFAVVVVTLPQRPWPIYRDAFLQNWDGGPIVPVADRIVYWPPESANPSRSVSP